MDNFIKVIKALVDALMTLILIFGIAFIILYVVGIEPYVVVSGSMEPAIKKGSLSFINKHSKYSNVKEGDIIAYTTPAGAKVTHRVISIKEEGLETKGDRNNIPDNNLITEKNFLGKNIFSIPQVGYGVKLLQTEKGRIVLIVYIIVILSSSFLVGDKDKKNKKDNE